MTTSLRLSLVLTLAGLPAFAATQDPPPAPSLEGAGGFVNRLMKKREASTAAMKDRIDAQRKAGIAAKAREKEAAKSAEFRAVVDGDKYVCRNGKGETGFNPNPLVGFGLALKDRECVDMPGANLKKDIGAFNYRGANLKGADLRWAVFANADFSGAVLAGAQMRQANFSYSIFHKADLSGADLTQANFTNADLTDADLRGATMRAGDIQGMIVKGAKFDERTVLPIDESAAVEFGMVKVDKDGKPVPVAAKAASSPDAVIEAQLKALGVPVEPRLVAIIKQNLEVNGLPATPQTVRLILQKMAEQMTGGRRGGAQDKSAYRDGFGTTGTTEPPLPPM